ncbi:hypothetical protein ACFFU9_08495 [Mariniflexile ostreae]|uniref:Collagen triple helix repeat protein n=1 Tax=Mariniflexile ostreae TaxID=1520892 RepID=A0ABV5FBN5_9FLAO
MKKILLLFILLAGSPVFSQVGIGTDMPSSSAQLEIKSSNKGVLIPQISLTSATDQNTITAGNLESLLVYNTTTNTTLSPGYYYWQQDRWNKLTTETDLPDHIVFWDIVKNEFTYSDPNGDLKPINISNLETLTFIGLNSDGYSLEYTGENGNLSSIDLREVVKNVETLTTLKLNEDRSSINYVDENGDLTQLSLSNLVKNLETLSTLVDNGDGTITYTDENNDNVIINLSTGPQGVSGVDGKDGDTPEIGTNGHWFISGVDTQQVAQGPKGDVGERGIQGETGLKGDQGERGIQGEQGVMGATGAAGQNGIDGKDGKDGDTPEIGTNGHWFISGIDTQQVAQGPKGDKGDVGERGIQGETGLKGDQGEQGPAGVVSPKDLSASDTSITVANGIGATLLDANVKVTDGGITTEKLANGAGTALKINADVAGVGLIKNTATHALDVQTHNGLSIDATADAIQLGGSLVKPTVINTNATNTLAITGLESGTYKNNLLVVDPVSGVVKQLKAALPTFFYMPSVVIYTAADQVPLGDVFGTVNLYAKYKAQFETPMVSNPGATTSIPVLQQNELDYFITWYDTSVFENVSISNTGILTYSVKTTAEVSLGSFMNIIFTVKPD